MIPKNLTHAEVGAFLCAVGTHMIDNNVCADAVLDPKLLDVEEYFQSLWDAMSDADWASGMDSSRAKEILGLTSEGARVPGLSLEEAVNFNANSPFPDAGVNLRIDGADHA